MRIDLLVATYNRAELLARLLESVGAAERPAGLEIRTIVVDNNSSDDTAAVVASATRQHRGAVEYRFEPKQGKVHALHHGLSIADADLIGLVDDDEEIDPGWFTVANRVLGDPSIDFISGPCLPKWGASPPAWLPPEYRGVIGWMGAGDRVLEYGSGTAGVGFGGNAVVRAAAGAAVGWFNVELGRRGASAGGCEDVDFFERLLLAGKRGLYIPDLVIHHYIPAQRLTKRYHRHWCFHRAMSQARVEQGRRQPVPHLMGVPRYRVGSAARAVPSLLVAPLRRRWNTPGVFARELAVWELAGYMAGLLRFNPEA